MVKGREFPIEDFEFPKGIAYAEYSYFVFGCFGRGLAFVYGK